MGEVVMDGGRAQTLVPVVRLLPAGRPAGLRPKPRVAVAVTAGGVGHRRGRRGDRGPAAQSRSASGGSSPSGQVSALRLAALPVAGGCPKTARPGFHSGMPR